MRSKLEEKFHKQFPSLGYEEVRLPYICTHHYTPDFTLGEDLFVECKGLWDSADRSKHLAVRSQNPRVKILFVFQNPRLKLSKKSKTSYADWCDKHGFKWLDFKDVGKFSNQGLIDLLTMQPVV